MRGFNIYIALDGKRREKIGWLSATDALQATLHAKQKFPQRADRLFVKDSLVECEGSLSWVDGR